MDETGELSRLQQLDSAAPEKPRNISFSIWPPTQRTRDAVIARLIETLSAPSVLSKRYGALPQDEAPEVARRIEDEAFGAAEASDAAAGEDGIEILQVYAKEISHRMISTIKSRSATASAPDGDNASPATDAVAAGVESLSIETEV